jgi:hypothetical protein
MSHHRLTQQLRRTACLAIAACTFAARPTSAITLADSTTFTAKGTWDATALAIPLNLGGIRFSSDGTTLYAVGSADVPSSAMYAIPVVRDPSTHEIVDLAMAAATPVFTANVSTPAGGLDSGPEEGPAGTLFYTYFNANGGNFIGERRAGDLMEMQFDLAPQGVPLWLSGLAFSPARIDAATGFGMLNVSVYDGDPDTTPRDVFELPLSAAGTGFFAPGTATRLLSLADGTVNGICYVPGGSFAGSLMYASFDAGEIHYVDVDPASGLPIDKTSGQPLLGTVDPVDHLFASDLGIGPLGLDFDPLTNDLFVSTYEGTPANSIIQIGGFPVATTTTSTTTTPGASSSTSTSSSTTTLPTTCGGTVTFDSMRCRIDAMLAEVQQLSGVDAVRDKIGRKLALAAMRLETGASRLAAGRKRPARGAVGKAVKLVRGVAALLQSRKAQAIPAPLRASLGTEANEIQQDLLALKHGI